MSLYRSEIEASKIAHMMMAIRSGKFSRNKNYFTLANANEYNLFKRARLLLSLLEDMENTHRIKDHKIWINDAANHREINLYNPELRYRRSVRISQSEFSIIESEAAPLISS